MFRSTPELTPPQRRTSQDEEGKDDGKGGRELTKGSLIELIGASSATALWLSRALLLTPRSLPPPVRLWLGCACAERRPLRCGLCTRTLALLLTPHGVPRLRLTATRTDKENLKVYLDFESNNFEKNGAFALTRLL